MVYSDYFTLQDHKLIHNKSYFYHFKTHLTITFARNLSEQYHYLHDLINFFNDKGVKFEFYGWNCKASKKKKNDNSHNQSRKHAHIIILSKIDIKAHLGDFFSKIAQDSDLSHHIEQYHTNEIKDIDGLLNYIHDKHHTIYKTVYKHDNIINFRYFHHFYKVVTNKKLELEIQEPKIQIQEEEQKQEPEISKKEISLPFFVQRFKFIKFNINKVNYYYRKITYHNTS